MQIKFFDLITSTSTTDEVLFLTLIASTSSVDPNSVSSFPFSLKNDESGDAVDNRLLGVADEGPPMPQSIDKGSS